jgi:hypothetical protein
MSEQLRIHRPGTDMWLLSHIDSSGMSVHWTGMKDASDVFASRKDADAFLARVQERYPNEKFEVI